MKTKRGEEERGSDVSSSSSSSNSSSSCNGKRTMVVGVKLDGPSKELLTWSLVKVAHPGDRIIALHVLNSFSASGNGDGEGQSSLLSLVKAFESVLTVYHGFCNLKQVDLKLKICRGSSVRKVLVREAKTLAATKVILGVAKNHRRIGSLVSIANYCAKKLPLDCCVLAVNNGKVVFQRESTVNVYSSDSGKKTEDCRQPTRLFGAFRRTWSKNSKVLNSKTSGHPLIAEGKIGKNDDWEDHRSSGADSTYSGSDCSGITADDDMSNNSVCRTCSICAPNSVSPEEALCTNSAEEDRDDSLALVTVQTLEAASSSISLLIRELPELRPGWPLLRRTILPNRNTSERSKVKQISVVQWAMRVPVRHSAATVHPDQKPMKVGCASVEAVHDAQCGAPNLDGESGAMVPVGNVTSPIPDEDESKSLPKELESLQEKYSSTCRIFSYQELVSATSNFSSDKLIGKGGSSQVYKGCLPDGKELAVKILKSSQDAVKEFISEIEIITTLHHKNIISLFGFCFEDKKLILVYDFLLRGSLEDHLHGKKDQTVFSWGGRYKVAVGVAEALDYLHSGSSQPVIHRDVKSSNILLADDFEPQLSDFGLASLALTTSSHIRCSDVAGTFGYLAPEYFMYGKVNDKIDVYAFGVVLLELLTGRKPISNQYPKGQESLVMWAKPILQSGKTMQLLDPSLGDKYDNNQMEKIVLAASLCIRRAPQLRPRIGLILKLLQGDDEVTKWARLQVSASDEFDGLDDEGYPTPNIQSHLSLALLDVEDDSLSVSSTEPSLNYLTANRSWEDYLKERWSRSSSFD
ncbi:protein kinase STUNTED-like [Magnolia sinica]|uniref:protein kinase STUNTED-like n=1 Tax=Magnolia sinica TaxID=86752 RepID=UPI002658435C|nr:protein kinase STUNTED-like [Magnolia sinica]